MTLKQIEKTREFLSLIDSAQGLTNMQRLTDEIRAFYGEDFNVNLNIRTWNTPSVYNLEYNLRDQKALKGFLEGYLAKEGNNDIICEILDLINEGQTLKDEENKLYKYIIKIYHSFNDKIKFDDYIKTIATAPKEALTINGYSITKDRVSGLIVKLRAYANLLCQSIKVDEPYGHKQEINFYPNINVEAKNENNINLVNIFEKARQQADDEGLPDEQYKIILSKLAELEELATKKESKGNRWQKVKEIMKWLAEQGIQVAGILLPVLAQTI